MLFVILLLAYLPTTTTPPQTPTAYPYGKPQHYERAQADQEAITSYQEGIFNRLFF